LFTIYDKFNVIFHDKHFVPFIVIIIIIIIVIIIITVILRKTLSLDWSKVKAHYQTSYRIFTKSGIRIIANIFQLTTNFIFYKQTYIHSVRKARACGCLFIGVEMFGKEVTEGNGTRVLRPAHFFFFCRSSCFRRN
jgi:hypothetical protein